LSNGINKQVQFGCGCSGRTFFPTLPLFYKNGKLSVLVLLINNKNYTDMLSVDEMNEYIKSHRKLINSMPKPLHDVYVKGIIAEAQGIDFGNKERESDIQEAAVILQYLTLRLSANPTTAQIVYKILKGKQLL
jgi:hypothetical protein